MISDFKIFFFPLSYQQTLQIPKVLLDITIKKTQNARTGSNHIKLKKAEIAIATTYYIPWLKCHD